MAVLEPKVLEDIPIVSYSDQPTTAIKTGTWKFLQPRYEDKLPPCSHACPAGNDISKIIALLAQGDLMQAGQLLRSSNPFPATLGRVCPHFCERQCNRETLGGAVAVHMLERFLGDQSLESESSPPPLPATGRRVAVIGAGPAGITAAYLLALAGHRVKVFDDKPKPGGFLRTGIPDYRLPKAILDREIEAVERVGVKFTQEVRVGTDVNFGELKNGFDAVIVAVGAHALRPLAIPGIGSRYVFNGVALLEQILLGQIPRLPNAAAVIGGGNTAIDIARSLLRLGVKATVVYRRTEAEMPAIASEVKEAKQEGIAFHFLAAPTKIVLDGDVVVALECRQMKLGEADASGRRAPVPIPNSEFRLPVDGVVTAIGETVDLEFLSKEEGGNLAEQRPLESNGVFFAGDAVTSEGTVTAAVGSGRRVAALVDGYLAGRGMAQEAPSLQSLWERQPNFEKVADAKFLNSTYFTAEPRTRIRRLAGVKRSELFAEIVQGFSAKAALDEARRCLGCGTCNGCLNCYYWCPDVAIHRGSRNGELDIDLEHCKGCGICVEECPRGAMTLEEVGR